MQDAPKGESMEVHSTRIPDDVDAAMKGEIDYEDGERPSGYIRDAIVIRLYLENDRQFLKEAENGLDSAETAHSD